jgi:acyl-CoA thioesterase FadM
MPPFGPATEQVIKTTPLTIHRRVRWGECDPAGVVYTVNFCEYVASAFELFMAALLGGPLQTMKQQHGLATPARALALEFMAPLRPDEEFTMTVAVAGVRTKTFDLIIVGRSVDGRDTFRAKLTAIAVDPESRTAIPVPDVLRQRLDRYKGACDAFAHGDADV